LYGDEIKYYKIALQITINGVLYGDGPLHVTKNTHLIFEINGKGWKRM